MPNRITDLLSVLLLVPGCFYDCPHSRCQPVEIVLQVPRWYEPMARGTTLEVSELREVLESMENDEPVDLVALDTERLTTQIIAQLRGTSGEHGGCWVEGTGSASLHDLVVMTPRNAPMPEAFEGAFAEASASCNRSEAELMAAILRPGDDELGIDGFIVGGETLAGSIQRNLIDTNSKPMITLEDLVGDYERLEGRFGPSNDDAGTAPGFLLHFDAPRLFSAIEVPGTYRELRFHGADLLEALTVANPGSTDPPPRRQITFDGEYEALELVPAGDSLPTHPRIDAMGLRLTISSGTFRPCVASEPESCPQGGVLAPPSYWAAARWSLQYVLVDALREQYASLNVSPDDLGLDCPGSEPSFSIADGWVVVDGIPRGFIWELMTEEILATFGDAAEATISICNTHLWETTEELVAEAGVQLSDRPEILRTYLGRQEYPPSDEPFDVFFDRQDESSYLLGASSFDPTPDESRCEEGEHVRFHRGLGFEREGPDCGDGELVVYEDVERCRFEIEPEDTLFVERCDDLVYEVFVVDAKPDRATLRIWPSGEVIR